MRTNLAARAGQWSAAHWKTATFGWIVFVLAAVVLGGAVGTKQIGNNESSTGESGRMDRILDDAFKTEAPRSIPRSWRSSSRAAGRTVRSNG
jgi:hypothetical protein